MAQHLRDGLAARARAQYPRNSGLRQAGVAARDRGLAAARQARRELVAVSTSTARRLRHSHASSG